MLNNSAWIQASGNSYLYNIFARIFTYRGLKFLGSSSKPRDRSPDKNKAARFSSKIFWCQNLTAISNESQPEDFRVKLNVNLVYKLDRSFLHVRPF